MQCTHAIHKKITTRGPLANQTYPSIYSQVFGAFFEVQGRAGENGPVGNGPVVWETKDIAIDSEAAFLVHRSGDVVREVLVNK